MALNGGSRHRNMMPAIEVEVDRRRTSPEGSRNHFLDANQHYTVGSAVRAVHLVSPVFATFDRHSPACFCASATCVAGYSIELDSGTLIDIA
jgi:hypothetical protein